MAFSPSGSDLGDVGIGLILLVVSLVMLCGCLMGLVKLLNSLLGERVKEVIAQYVNRDIPHLPWLTGYLAMLLGAGLTVLVQSSSVFTSTLTPLANSESGEPSLASFSPPLNLGRYFYDYLPINLQSFTFKAFVEVVEGHVNVTSVLTY